MVRGCFLQTEDFSFANMLRRMSEDGRWKTSPSCEYFGERVKTEDRGLLLRKYASENE